MNSLKQNRAGLSGYNAASEDGLAKQVAIRLMVKGVRPNYDRILEELRVMQSHHHTKQ